MYSRDERMKVIKLYLKYEKCPTDVCRELGYPKDPRTIKYWYEDYQKELKTGILWERKKKKEKYTPAQKQTAVDHFLEHGRNITRTVRKLGYPSRETLRQWCEELSPWTRKMHKGGIQCTKEHKEKAVIEFCTRTDSAESVAKKHGVTRKVLYKWKNDLLGEEVSIPLKKKKDKPISSDRDALLSEVEKLEQEVRRLKMEKAILDKATELIKKDRGIILENLTNKEKAVLIDALRDKYPLNDLIKSLGIARSSYFYHHKVFSLPDKYEDVRDNVIALFKENKKRYGYRRIHGKLAEKDMVISEKIVRRIMSECNLVAKGNKKRKYSSYQGESQPAAENLIEQYFHADAPNERWLTDITEFHIPAGKIYLSPIVDCFDGLLVSWTISTSPNAELVNTMLDHAISTLKPDEYPLVHSDRGTHYRWPGWLSRMEERGLKRSMSKKGCSPDNATCEGVFGRVKNEMFYNESWTGVSIDDFMNVLNEYLVWYNEERIKMSLGAKSPLNYRRSLGLAA